MSDMQTRSITMSAEAWRFHDAHFEGAAEHARTMERVARASADMNEADYAKHADLAQTVLDACKAGER